MAKAAKPPAVRGGPNNAQRAEIVKTALTAWTAIMAGDGDRWHYWEAVCAALRLCRDDAMPQCGLDPNTDETPTKNGRYNTPMTRLLTDIGLRGIPKSSRKAGIECSYHLKEIGAWREELRVSHEEKERAQYLNLNHPQVVWRDFSKWKGWMADREETERTFLQLTVKKALVLPDSAVAAGLAQNLPAKRTYSIAAAMLHRLDPQMRAIVADALDVPSRLSDVLSFGQGDRENAEIALLTARIAELEQTAKDRPVSSSKEWATGDETAAKIADLADRLRTAEAQIMRYHDEQFADNNDPVPKAAYKDAADKARIAREAADQRIRELEAERDDWRVRTHAELEQRYRGRTANAERERDDAVKARDTAVVELRAAERRIAAMREPLTVERYNEAQKCQRAEVSERIAAVRARHAAKQEGR